MKPETRGALAALAVVCAAGPALCAEPPRFVAEPGSGVTQVYDGDWEFFVGGGVAAFDCDGDRKPELFMAGGSRPATLYRNLSAPGGPLRFAAVPDSGLGLDAVTGAYPIDVDADGLTDLAVLRVGANALFRGLGDCRFEPADARWGFDGGSAWSTGFSATWEQPDGLPTLAVGNYVDRDRPGAPWGTCHDNRLFRPDASGRRFAAPIDLRPSHCALSLLFTDWDRSGRRDLRVSNDRQYYRGGEEQLWRVEAGAEPRLYAREEGWMPLTIWGMGIASADLDGDGYPEYLLTSMGDNKLRRLAEPGAAGGPPPRYADQAYKLGVTAHRPSFGGDTNPSTAWHAQFADLDNDGRLDLFIAKGNVEAMAEAARRDHNVVLLRGPDGGYVDVTEASGAVSFERGRGAAVVDLNLDGLLDLAVVNRRVPAELWRNVGAGDADRPRAMGRWLQLRLRQPGGNRDAVGSWIELRAGDRIEHRELTVGGGHAGGQLGWLHFGLGAAERAAVRVRWPDGARGPWLTVAADSFVTIDRGTGAARLWLP